MARDFEVKSHLGSVGIDPTQSSDPEQQAINRLLKAIEDGDHETATAEYEQGRKLYGWNPRQPQTTQRPYKPRSYLSAPRTMPPELNQ